MSDNGTDEQLTKFYRSLRRAVGLLGMGLPLLLAVGAYVWDGTRIQPSISDYYATDVRNLLVGVLFAIGIFLASYRGYDGWDRLAGKSACLFALGVAMCPNSSAIAIVSKMHFVCAMALFIVLACFCLFLFTKTKPDVPMTARKRSRNWVYRASGIAILACILALALYFAFLQGSELDALDPVFWLESFALMAFGVSWITKGDLVWPDE